MLEVDGQAPGDVVLPGDAQHKHLLGTQAGDGAADPDGIHSAKTTDANSDKLVAEELQPKDNFDRLLPSKGILGATSTLNAKAADFIPKGSGTTEDEHEADSEADLDDGKVDFGKQQCKEVGAEPVVGTEPHIAVQVNSGKAVEGNLQGNPNQSQRREEEPQAGSSVEAPGRLYQTKLECARVPDLDEGIGEYARNGFSDEYLHKVVRTPVQRAGSCHPCARRPSTSWTWT